MGEVNWLDPKGLRLYRLEIVDLAECPCSSSVLEAQENVDKTVYRQPRDGPGGTSRRIVCQ